jgi:inorganic pyrophosphatase
MSSAPWPALNDATALDSSSREPPEVDVVVEVPRGSFLKRGSTGRVDFVSPLPCPFNYGSVPTHIGLEGDLLDALVLGPRLRLGARVHVKAWGAVTLTDRGMSDDKLVCGERPPSPSQRRNLLWCWRRPNVDHPCRLNIDQGWKAVH